MIRQDAPEGAEVLDLAGVRAARAELHKDQPAPVVKVSAGYIELKHEVDVTASDDFTVGKFSEGLKKLLADPADLDELVKDGLSKEDINSIVRVITGRSLGE